MKTTNILPALVPVAKALGSSSKSLQKAGSLVVPIINKHGFTATYRALSKLVPGFSAQQCRNLYALGKGTLLKEVYLCEKLTRSPRVLKMTVDAQLRLLSGVNVFISDTVPSIRVHLSEMTCRQFTQVVDEHGKIRNVVAQRAYLRGLAKAANRPVRWSVDEDKIRVMTTGTIDLQDLNAMLFALRG